MKNFFIAACLMLGFASFATAQESARKKPASTKLQKSKPAVAAAPAVDAAAPVKADGTLDKRYKVNKATAAGPLKADGTPDKRYKANKNIKKKKPE